MIVFIYKWYKNGVSDLLSGRVIELVAPAETENRLYSLSFHSQHAMPFARQTRDKRNETKGNET